MHSLACIVAIIAAVTSAFSTPSASKSPGRKVAIVTGGTQGSGRSIVGRFHKAGYDVAFCARDASRVENLQESLSRGVGRVVGYSVDVGDQSAVKSMVEEVLSEFGKVDVLVNNAGICLQGNLEDTLAEDWDRIMNTNVFGAIHFTTALAPIMKQQGGGAIVNLGSFGGKMPLPGMAAYCTSKYALDGFTETVRLELAPHNIKVHGVHPGVINSDFLERAQFRFSDAGRNEDAVEQMRQALSSPLASTPDEIARAVFQAVQSDREVEQVVGPTSLAVASWKLGPQQLLRRALSLSRAA